MAKIMSNEWFVEKLLPVFAKLVLIYFFLLSCLMVYSEFFR